MRGRCLSLGITLATAVSISSPLRTQTAQPAGQRGADAAGKPAAQPAPAPVHDINGIWMRHTPRGVDGGNGATYTKNLPEMTAWGQAKFKEAKDSNGGKYTLQETNDPVLTKCYPPGVPRVYFHPYPFEFNQTPKYVLMLYEYDHQVRRIYTDGRPLPTDPDLTWMGTSVGHWEGDSTLGRGHDRLQRKDLARSARRSAQRSVACGRALPTCGPRPPGITSHHDRLQGAGETVGGDALLRIQAGLGIGRNLLLGRLSRFQQVRRPQIRRDTIQQVDKRLDRRDQLSLIGLQLNSSGWLSTTYPPSEV